MATSLHPHPSLTGSCRGSRVDERRWDKSIETRCSKTMQVVAENNYSHSYPRMQKKHQLCMQVEKRGAIVQEGGVEPPTSAVLRPRHNQLDHPCLADLHMSFNKPKCYKWRCDDAEYANPFLFSLMSLHNPAVDETTDGCVRSVTLNVYSDSNSS